MKILITILLALFLSSTANANSLEEVCEWAEKLTIKSYTNAQTLKEAYYNEFTKDEPNKSREDRLGKSWTRAQNDIAKWAKTYHYLDCSDFRE
tara:strand:- start:394 stop:672 length:279 start_codon:yes stop_codon:yes gene_type:complete